MNTPAANDTTLPEPQAGTRIDDFTVAYLISHGMNADLFAVWHHKLHAPLVCKRLRPADEHDAKWRRLLRAEGAALASLNHPGIVRLISQKMRARLPYLLLEHAGKETLRDLLQREKGGLNMDYAVRIIQHAGGALAYVHRQGFIHRDLKPSNIILREGRPVLLDFGVVWRWRSGRRPPDRSGTPQYLAPEQIRREPLGPATDIYGLGLLLFELLTGQRPFSAGADRHDSRIPLEQRYPQLVETPLTPQSAGRRMPPALAEIIKRCLSRDPRARYRSVPQLLAALDPFTRLKVWPQNAIGPRVDFSPFE
ncbi:MAG TPA: serine/threonine-protein kinase [Pyrinomonadaceae bacterium]|jgi:serine/threonine-protein kinase